MNRAQDVLTALAFLKSHTRGRVELIGLGEAGVWCLFAAATAPVEIDLLFVVDNRSSDVAVVRTDLLPRSLFTIIPTGRSPNAIAVKSYKVQ